MAKIREENGRFYCQCGQEVEEQGMIPPEKMAAQNCGECCDGNSCCYGCETCFCECHN